MSDAARLLALYLLCLSTSPTALFGQANENLDAIAEFRAEHPPQALPHLRDWGVLAQANVITHSGDPSRRSLVLQLEDPLALDELGKKFPLGTENCRMLPASPVSPHAYSRSIQDMLNGATAAATGRIVTKSLRQSGDRLNFTAEILVDHLYGSSDVVSSGSVLVVELPAGNFKVGGHRYCVGSPGQLSFLSGDEVNQVVFLLSDTSEYDQTETINPPYTLLWIQEDGLIFFGRPRTGWNLDRIRSYLADRTQEVR